MRDVKILPLILIAFAVVLRLLPHAPNFAPIGALALFGGMYLPRKYALLVPLLALFVSDMFVGFYGLTMIYVYASFALISVIGSYVKLNKSLSTVFGGTILGSLLFFILTNFGVWVSTTMYPHTIGGLYQCFLMAIPFFRNTVLGDMFYVGLFVGAYEAIYLLTKNKIPDRVKTYLY